MRQLRSSGGRDLCQRTCPHRSCSLTQNGGCARTRRRPTRPALTATAATDREDVRPRGIGRRVARRASAPLPRRSAADSPFGPEASPAARDTARGSRRRSSSIRSVLGSPVELGDELTRLGWDVIEHPARRHHRVAGGAALRRRGQPRSMRRHHVERRRRRDWPSRLPREAARSDRPDPATRTLPASGLATGHACRSDRRPGRAPC